MLPGGGDVVVCTCGGGVGGRNLFMVQWAREFMETLMSK